jgi:hypothetical protein
LSTVGQHINEVAQMSSLIPVLCLSAFVGVAVAAKRTQRTETDPSALRARLTRVLLGVLGYPAAIALIWVLQPNSDLTFGLVALFMVPGVVFGALVGRLWIVSVPAVAAGAWLLVRYLGDPGCVHNCGEDDTWPVIVLMTTFFAVLPAVFSLLLGILARNLLGPAVERLCPSATSRANPR